MAIYPDGLLEDVTSIRSTLVEALHALSHDVLPSSGACWDAIEALRDALEELMPRLAKVERPAEDDDDSVF